MTDNSDISVSDNESNIPSREQCQKLVEEFATVTGTDEALAQFFLQDRDWNLERSIDAYFEAKNDSAVRNDVENLEDSDIAVTFDSTIQSLLSKLPGTISTEPPHNFMLMTMNLDGLDQHNLKKRTKAVIKIIEMERPDIVFLQEVIPATFNYMEENLPGYMFVAGGSHDYFIATLVLRTTVYFDGHALHPFPQSVMSRNMLAVDCHIGSLKLRLLNTHLESTAEFSQERKNQLKACLKHLTAGTKEYTSLLGGDLNLRDKEVDEVGLPSGVSDLWEVCGRRSECKFTWDTVRNSNKSFPGKFKPRLRFDRVYLHNSSPPSVKPNHFGLTGIQKVSGTQSFPSDHWGILVNFTILNQKAKSSSPPPSYFSSQVMDVAPSTSSCNTSCSNIAVTKSERPDKEVDSLLNRSSCTSDDNDDSIVLLQNGSEELKSEAELIDLE